MSEKKVQVWKSEELFFEGDDYFDRVIAEIDQAKTSIEVETYIYRDDVIGRRLADALVRAAERGLQVRLIIDGIGASGWHEKNASALESQGVHVRIYHPVLFANLMSRLALDLGLRKARSPKTAGSLISRLNRRDHRKIFILDSQILYVGSLNITDDHSKRVRGKDAWRDTAARVTGGPIEKMIFAYNAVWNRCHDARAKRRWRDSLLHRPRRLRPSRLLRLNHTRRLRKRSYSELLHRISTAQSRVWLTNAYFAPSRKITKALQAASQNGADVRILVPRNSDVFFMPWVATAHYHLILKEGAKIYEYLPRFLHAKTALIDHWATVGSSNLNGRSVFHDFEADIVLVDKTAKQILADQFAKDLEEAEQVLETRGGISAFFTAFLGRLISRLMKSWI